MPDFSTQSSPFQVPQCWLDNYSKENIWRRAARTVLPCVYQSVEQWTLLNFKSHCVAISLPSLSAKHHHPRVHVGGPALPQWPATAMILISPELSCLAVELISRSQILPLPPVFPLVLPEQSAYEKFIQSLFHWGRLSHFICHCLIASAKHAGRPKCVGLGFPLPCETVDISFIS